MKNKTGQLRQIVLIAMMLILCFGIYISSKGGYMVHYGLLLPMGMMLIARNFSEDGLPSGSPMRWAAASGVVCLAALMFTGLRSSRWTEQILMGWCVVVYSLFVMGMPRKAKAEELRDEFMHVGGLFTCLYLPFALLALVSVFTGRVFNLPLVGEPFGIRTAGANGERIRIFMHPNGTSQYAMLIIIFAIYAIMNHRSRAAKAFYAFNILVNLLVMAHAQSRTSNVALGGALGMMAFRAVWLCPKLRKVWLRAAVGVLVAAIVLVSAIECVSWIYKFDVGMTTEQTASEVVSRTAASNQDDISGRGRIWGNAVGYIADHPEKLIAGMGVSRMKTMSKEREVLQPFGTVHNSFLEVLAMCGLPALICVVGLLCSLVRPALRVWLAPKREGMPGMFLFPTLMAMMLAISMMESSLFVNPWQGNFFFYLVCGYTLHCDALMKRGEFQKRETAHKD